MLERLNRLARFWLGDARFEARTSLDAMLPSLIAFAALCVGLHTVHRATRHLLHAPPPRTIPADGPGDARFGLTLATRQEIFREFALAEPSQRAAGLSSFPTERWSAEDHRGSFERGAARNLATRHSVSLTQIYLVLDEGIREKWPGPDGKPLDATTIPLKPRRKY